MHERSITRQLLLQLEELMAPYRSDHVVSIRISVGEFSGIEPSLLSIAFDEMSLNTSVEGAELIVDAVPLEGRCNICTNEFLIHQFTFECPRCGSSSVTFTRGEELML